MPGDRCTAGRPHVAYFTIFCFVPVCSCCVSLTVMRHCTHFFHQFVDFQNECQLSLEYTSLSSHCRWTKFSRVSFCFTIHMIPRTSSSSQRLRKSERSIWLTLWSQQTFENFVELSCCEVLRFTLFDVDNVEHYYDFQLELFFSRFFSSSASSTTRFPMFSACWMSLKTVETFAASSWIAAGRNKLLTPLSSSLILKISLIGNFV